MFKSFYNTKNYNIGSVTSEMYASFQYRIIYLISFIYNDPER